MEITDKDCGIILRLIMNEGEAGTEDKTKIKELMTKIVRLQHLIRYGRIASEINGGPVTLGPLP